MVEVTEKASEVNYFEALEETSTKVQSGLKMAQEGLEIALSAKSDLDQLLIESRSALLSSPADIESHLRAAVDAYMQTLKVGKVPAADSTTPYPGLTETDTSTESGQTGASTTLTSEPDLESLKGGLDEEVLGSNYPAPEYSEEEFTGVDNVTPETLTGSDNSGDNNPDPYVADDSQSEETTANDIGTQDASSERVVEVEQSEGSPSTSMGVTEATEAPETGPEATHEERGAVADTDDTEKALGLSEIEMEDSFEPWEHPAESEAKTNVEPAPATSDDEFAADAESVTEGPVEQNQVAHNECNQVRNQPSSGQAYSHQGQSDEVEDLGEQGETKNTEYADSLKESGGEAQKQQPRKNRRSVLDMLKPRERAEES